MTLMKDLIAIPEKVQRGDFVLNLSQGLADEAIDQTLRDYVVTPQLAKSFDDALSFVKSTVDSNQHRQKGAYLHGSFGSGKSHFMAVLNLLLQGNEQARSIVELQPAVAKNDAWLQGKNILLVPYHMIGAASIESGVLGGYANYIKKQHPEAPVPGFYMSDRLFTDAAKQRNLLGDDAFFQAINAGNTSATDDEGWGDVATGWDAISFDAVINGQSSPEDKNRLVGDLVGTLFGAFADLANTQSGGYVTFDEGLRVMTQHAKDLGYDAVILFLDELILWLASRLSDQQFISTEIQKVVKLVEASEPRALPLVSFIARQRDLREFVGDQYTGAEQEVLSDSLKYWEGRFHTITLEDRNLPVIAEKRLLRPINEQAKNEIAASFASTDRYRKEVQDILLTQQGDKEMFRSLYPFSPALVQALVALSSALQRERTALKVMLMLLVSQRETLALGNVIPVGDLYDVIASEAEPFSEAMRMHFDNAKSLFDRKLIPLLESEHQIERNALADMDHADPRKRAFLNDMRLIKTLLLSALVPEVECFKGLTANKLSALNHGTIKSPIPGGEVKQVLNKCRKWAGQVGEIKISDDPNPTIAIQLSGVDTESILEQAKIHDNEANRRQLVKELVFDAFGVKDDQGLFIEHSLLWKGTRRNIEVMFQNIREVKDLSIFEARDDEWKVIVDFPFDKENHSPADDKARIEEFESSHNVANTLCWLPYFFSQSARKDLGTLAKLEYILKNNDRFNTFSKHLSPVDRAQARTLLENQRSQLNQRIRDYLMGAYGASEPQPGSLDDSIYLERQVYSLQPAFSPQLPIGSNLGRAFEQLLGQALSFQFPAHPDFDCEVKVSDLGKVMEELRKAIHDTNGRIYVETPKRPLMRAIAQPLGLGEMHENHYIFKKDWCQHLTRELAKDGDSGSITVKRLRAAMDLPSPKGLPETVQNLLVMVFAEEGQYDYSLHGGPYTDVVLKDIPDELVLIKQNMAEPVVWKAALDNAGKLFGTTVNPLRTAANQNDLQKQVHDEVEIHLDACNALVGDLETKLNSLKQNLKCNRLNNARLAVSVLETLQGKSDSADLVMSLSEVSPETSLEALAKSIKSAQSVSQTIEENNWELLEGIWALGDAESQGIQRKVCDALAADELVTSLSSALRQAQSEATAILTRQKPTPPPPPSVSPDPVKPVVTRGRKVVRQETKNDMKAIEARRLLKELETQLQEGDTLSVSFTVVREVQS